MVLLSIDDIEVSQVLNESVKRVFRLLQSKVWNLQRGYYRQVPLRNSIPNTNLW